jgi:hypothetical protein
MNGNMISERTLRTLESIQDVIMVEEGKELCLDETLERVLSFYRRFVPYD